MGYIQPSIEFMAYSLQRAQVAETKDLLESQARDLLRARRSGNRSVPEAAGAIDEVRQPL